MALRYDAMGRYDGTTPVARSDKGDRAGKASPNDALMRHSLLEGVEPSPVGITSWSQAGHNPGRRFGWNGSSPLKRGRKAMAGPLVGLTFKAIPRHEQHRSA